MEDFRVTQSGDEVQSILNQSPIDTSDIAGLKEADALLDSRLESVEGKIPAGASAENPLTDKQYVDNAVATASATFRGTYNEVTDLELTTEATHTEIATALADAIDTADNNDYCFVQIPTSDATPTEISCIERYKFVTGTGWEYEYTLNRSGFTSDQWAAINSGITSALVTKLTDLPTNSELTILLNGKANAADVYTKSETYNKTELDNMITTPDVQYVTVTATAQTTAVTDLLPAEGAANTIYRIGSWNGTQYNANTYSEYVWDGTAYILLDVKNPGIDSVPTAGSSNLVESGGVDSRVFDDTDTVEVTKEVAVSSSNQIVYTTTQKKLKDTYYVQIVSSTATFSSDSIFGISIAGTNINLISLGNGWYKIDNNTEIGSIGDTVIFSVRANVVSAGGSIKVRLYVNRASELIDCHKNLNILNAAADDADVPFFEYGSINSSGAEVTNYIFVRTGYLRAPFRLKFKQQYAFGGVWMYNKSGDTYTYFKKASTYFSGNTICASDSSHYYRVVISLNGNVVNSPNDVIESYTNPSSIELGTAVNEDKYTKQTVYPTLPCTRTNVSLGTLNTGYIYFSTMDGNIASSSSVYHTSPIAIAQNKLYEVKTNISRLYDAGVAYYSGNEISGDLFVGLDKAFIGDGVTSGNEIRTALLTPPPGATYVVIGTRSTSNISLTEITPQSAASVADLEGKVDKVAGKGLSTNDYTDEDKALVGTIDNKVNKINGKGLSTNDFSNEDKEKLDSLEPGGVPVAVVEAAVEDYLDEHSGGLIPQNLGVNLVPSYTYKLMPSIITDPATLPTGWSGDIANGFTHTSGNTDALAIDLSAYPLNAQLLITFNATGISGENNELYVSQGTKALIKSYNSTSTFVAGFINDGTDLLLTPTSSYDGTVTNLKVRKIDADNGTETYTVNEQNVYTDRKKLVAGYWNVAIGPSSTVQDAEDMTRSIAIGFRAMSSMVVGNRNVAIGTYALAYTTNADNSVAIGSDTLYPTTKRVENSIAIGKAALSGTGAMSDCIAIGVGVMSHYGLTTDRSRCVCIGSESGYDATSNCVHIGYRSGRNSNGANNTSVGYNSLGILTRTTVDITGTELTCVGYNASVANNATAKAAVNSTAVGANATITKSNQVVIGDGNVTEIVLGGKKLVFNDDNTVTWENVS